MPSPSESRLRGLTPPARLWFIFHSLIMPNLRPYSLVTMSLLVVADARAAEPETVEVRTLTGQTIKGNLESINDKDVVISGNWQVKVDQVFDMILYAN